ncbi:MAG: hypothetical protein WBA74_24525, partial [Cyclobacteriaceae bacterium]
MSNDNDMRENLSNEENEEMKEEQNASAEKESVEEDDQSKEQPGSAIIAESSDNQEDTDESIANSPVDSSEDEVSDAQEAIVEEAIANNSVTEDSQSEEEKTEEDNKPNPEEIPVTGYGEKEITPLESEEDKAKEEDNTTQESADNKEETNETEETEVEQVDYTTLSKAELLETAADLAKMDHFVKADNILKEITPLFNAIVSQERKEALEKFKADGSDPADFDYRDEDQQIFDGYYKIIK